MKIFDKDGKYNFVDQNNVLVGFDSYANCCESFGYFFSTESPKNIPPYCNDGDGQPANLDSFNFDPTFKESGYEMETFKLINGDEVIYLTIYNSHNGYYSHGFEMLNDGEVVFHGII
jgi:hypothetical protein